MSKISRRTFLRGVVTGAASLPLLSSWPALGADALPKLALTDPSAQALGYVEDAGKIDPAKEAAYKKGSACSGCALFQAAQAQGGYAPCAAFPGKLVNAKGWCRAFAPKA